MKLFRLQQFWKVLESMVQLVVSETAIWSNSVKPGLLEASLSHEATGIVGLLTSQ